MSRKMVSVEDLHGYTLDELIELKNRYKYVYSYTINYKSWSPNGQAPIIEGNGSHKGLNIVGLPKYLLNLIVLLIVILMMLLLIHLKLLFS